MPLDGGLTSFSDLSVSMPGEVARRAARECFDCAASGLDVRLDSQKFVCKENARTPAFRHFVLFASVLGTRGCDVKMVTFIWWGVR